MSESPLLAIHLDGIQPQGWGEENLRERFHEILNKAELAFGPRDPAWTLSITFGPVGPKMIVQEEGFHAEICLPSWEQSFELLCYHLAHECVHFLCPVRQTGTNFFEEGVTTTFASDCYNERNAPPPISPGDEDYCYAYDHMRQLLAIDGQAVKEIRSIQPTMSKISAGDILAGCPGASAELAAKLAAAFPEQCR